MEKPKYTYITKHEGSQSLSVCFLIEAPEPFRIGEKLNEIHEEAYMNGYNWEAFFNYYLQRHHPELTIGMGSDPEAGTYVAYYSLNLENEKKAEKLVEIIEHLVANEEELYEIVQNEGHHIEWD